MTQIKELLIDGEFWMGTWADNVGAPWSTRFTGVIKVKADGSFSGELKDKYGLSLINGKIDWKAGKMSFEKDYVNKSQEWDEEEEQEMTVYRKKEEIKTIYYEFQRNEKLGSWNGKYNIEGSAETEPDAWCSIH